MLQKPSVDIDNKW